MLLAIEVVDNHCTAQLAAAHVTVQYNVVVTFLDASGKIDYVTAYTVSS